MGEGLDELFVALGGRVNVSRELDFWFSHEEHSENYKTVPSHPHLESRVGLHYTPGLVTKCALSLVLALFFFFNRKMEIIVAHMVVLRTNEITNNISGCLG